MRNSKKCGFTLIELLVVVAIVAILAVVIAAKFYGSTQPSSTTVTVGKGAEATGTVLIDVVPVKGTLTSDSAYDVRDAITAWQRAHSTHRIRVITPVPSSAENNAIKALVITAYVEAERAEIPVEHK